MNFTTENIHRFHLWGAFTVDKPSKKHKGSTRKEYVLRPVITARRREDLPEAMRRAIKWWGGKGMSALYLQVEWMPGVRSINRTRVTDAKRWTTRMTVGTVYSDSLRRWCDDAIDTAIWQAPPYYWRTRRWDGHLTKNWVRPYASIGEAMRHRPSDSAVLVQGNRKVTPREIDAVCEVGSPFIKRFIPLPEDGREAETTTWRAPGLTPKIEVVEDGAPPPPPNPPEHWHVPEHDHEAVQALALVAQANQWVVRRLPLEHGLDVMFACAHPDVEAVRAHLVKQDEEDDD